MSSQQHAIAVQGLTYAYELGDGFGEPVLKNIDFNVSEGEFVAIIGPSGSGKSTLLHLLSGMLKLQQGTIHIAGDELGACDDVALAELRNQKLGFVFQQFHLLNHETVLENILLPGLYPLSKTVDRKALEDRARALAEQLGIAHRLQHKPNELSGGERQRTVVARALFNEANIILADEPTGNLDSHNTQQILTLLKDLNRGGKTIVVITHDPEVAEIADRRIMVKDGEIIESGKDTVTPDKSGEDIGTLSESGKDIGTPSKSGNDIGTPSKSGVALAKPESIHTKLHNLLTLVWRNLIRKRSQSFLTALGVSIGVASIMIMMTLGQFAKTRILASYEQMGASTVSFRGYPNFRVQATDKVGVTYKTFSVENDLNVISELFPQLGLLSPMTHTNGKTSYAGHVLQDNLDIFGVNQYYLPIIGVKPKRGINFSDYDVTNASAVCILGQTVSNNLFNQQNSLGKIISISIDQKLVTCTVIGVLPRQDGGGKSFSDPNKVILVPYTFVQKVASYWFTRAIFQFVATIDNINMIKPVGNAIKNYFTQKYGKSGDFFVDPATMLLQSMRTFLNIFTMMLATISVVSLIVAGLGITNMMLASISERLHEIGLRKAVGATDSDMYYSFLLEALILCLLAGGLGLLAGFSVYELILYVASQFVSKIQFAWLFEPLAISIALISMLAVGVFSGVSPAKKARDTDIIKCLH